MEQSLLAVNWIATIAVIAYAAYLFVYLIKTRIAYIKLGKKEEFDHNIKERLKNIGSMFSDKKSY